MYKIEVKNVKQFDTLGTEFLNNSLVLYGIGYESITFQFSFNGKILGEFTYKTDGGGKSHFRISFNQDEAVFLEEPTSIKTSHETVLVFKPIIRSVSKRETITLEYNQ